MGEAITPMPAFANDELALMVTPLLIERSDMMATIDQPTRGGCQAECNQSIGRSVDRSIDRSTQSTCRSGGCSLSHRAASLSLPMLKGA